MRGSSFFFSLISRAVRLSFSSKTRISFLLKKNHRLKEIKKENLLSSYDSGSGFKYCIDWIAFIPSVLSSSTGKKEFFLDFKSLIIINCLKTFFSYSIILSFFCRWRLWIVPSGISLSRTVFLDISNVWVVVFYLKIIFNLIFRYKYFYSSFLI